jgi:alkylation response protein AidB-like acyl-CoA dehydrogenase
MHADISATSPGYQPHGIGRPVSAWARNPRLPIAERGQTPSPRRERRSATLASVRSRPVAMAKYHTALAAGRIVDAAVQIFGGSGYLEESAVARHYRDVRVLRIGGGADEIQLEILSRELTP